MSRWPPGAAEGMRRMPGCTRDDGSVGHWGGLELTKDRSQCAEAERPSEPSAAVSLFAERSASHHRKRNASSCRKAQRPSLLAMMGRKAFGGTC
ncbi:hypothetical protein GUITHDRAFT_150543 [Guillardia theta CCMP2712]|uniref:Uncharacterized protein n=1 Tax=Guillardia theta (strain CCMP2712) TaxID=905079 RepID=L1JWD8_GUITC|nr:hypothetical protein GUITHDRAFT_150543 [Guillardia theta CCMP2712]EKX52408.1 hypothetical protein GUITHDRAFT_150543 [Guillardia theta CCMP2712]|eukprot:XP_005839388.1 hypothetical protein GUITHDRAFT_150543 [Guillardia theta CCMP2712]